MPGRGHETAFERLSGAGQELQDLHCLHTADDPDERRRDAGVGAALGKVGDLGIEAGIARISHRSYGRRPYLVA